MPAAQGRQPGRQPVLYVIACAAPPAADVGQLVSLAQQRGWDVCVLTTPSGRRFTDPAALERQTGHPVRSEYKNPGEPDVLPDPDAVIVAPATVNTINKWAAGICDTLALGILVEAIGKRLPIVALPSTNQAHAAHPAFTENIGKLRSWGVTVLFGADIHALPEPGADGSGPDRFPWSATLDALDARHGADRGRLSPSAALPFSRHIVWQQGRDGHAAAGDLAQTGSAGWAERLPARPAFRDISCAGSDPRAGGLYGDAGRSPGGRLGAAWPAASAGPGRARRGRVRGPVPGRVRPGLRARRGAAGRVDRGAGPHGGGAAAVVALAWIARRLWLRGAWLEALPLLVGLPWLSRVMWAARVLWTGHAVWRLRNRVSSRRRDRGGFAGQDLSGYGRQELSGFAAQDLTGARSGTTR